MPLISDKVSKGGGLGERLNRVRELRHRVMMARSLAEAATIAKEREMWLSMEEEEQRHLDLAEKEL